MLFRSVPSINVLQYVDGSGGSQAMTSNNEAELKGLYHGLRLVETIKPATTHFLLDSEYVLKGANEWLPKWRSNNWMKTNGTPVSNRDDWIAVEALLNNVKQHTKLTWEWVKGHSGNAGNEAADANATRGVYTSRHTTDDNQTFTFTPTKEYWNVADETHCLLMTPFWYFIMGSQQQMLDTPKGPYYVYWTGTEGRRDEGKFVGNPDSDLSYCTLFLKAPLPALDIVKVAQERLQNKTFGNAVVIGHLDNILKAKNHMDILEHGATALGNPANGIAVLKDNGDTLCHALQPAFKSLRAIEQLEAQERVMCSLMGSDVIDYYTLKDITDLIYDEVEVKKVMGLKVKPNLGGDTSSLAIGVPIKRDNLESVHDVILNFGIDAPRVNSFAHFADKEPKIYLATWPNPESTQAFRYGLLITLNKTDEHAFWVSPYSNLRIHL